MAIPPPVRVSPDRRHSRLREVLRGVRTAGFRKSTEPSRVAASGPHRDGCQFVSYRPRAVARTVYGAASQSEESGPSLLTGRTPAGQTYRNSGTAAAMTATAARLGRG